MQFLLPVSMTGRPCPKALGNQASLPSFRSRPTIGPHPDKKVEKIHFCSDLHNALLSHSRGISKK